MVGRQSLAAGGKEEEVLSEVLGTQWQGENLLSPESNRTVFRATCVRLGDSQPHVDIPTKTETGPVADEEEGIPNVACPRHKIR